MRLKIKSNATMPLISCLLFVISSLILLPTSFLFQYTPFNDIGTMFAVADSMRHGLVPFKDIFEQRGPIMYLLHVIAIDLVPKNPLHGIYLIEVLNFSGCFYLFHKIAKLRWQKPIIQSGLALVATVLLSQCYAYNYGASPEEFCLMPNLYALYLLCRYFKQPQTRLLLSNLESFLLGLGLGWQVLIKYSNINITSAVAILAFISAFSMHETWSVKLKTGLNLVGYAIIGFVIMFMPWLIYFGLHHGIHAFFYQYFIANLGVSHQSRLKLLLTVLKLNGLTIVLSAQILAFWFAPLIFGFKNLSKIKRLAVLFTIGWCLLTISLIVRFGLSYNLPFFALLIGFSIYGSYDVITALKHNQHGYIRSLCIDIPIIALLLLFLNPIALIKPTFKNTIFMPTALKFALNGQGSHMKVQNTDIGYRLGHYIKTQHVNQNILIYNGIPNSIYQNSASFPKLKYFDQTTIPYQSQPSAADHQIKYLAAKRPSAVVVPAYHYTRNDQKPFTVNMLPQLAHIANQEQNQSNLSASVTAVAQRIKVHPNDYSQQSIIITGKQHAFYNTATPLPKALLKNYRLGYVSDDQTQNVPYHKFSTTFAYMVWIRK